MDTAAYRKALLELRGELTERMSRLETHGREGVPADFEDQASARENDDVVHALVGRVQTELGEVKAALARIESGDYGVCVRWGEDIETERLHALPYAATCARCAT